jgi:hypothetical protein
MIYTSNRKNKWDVSRSQELEIKVAPLMGSVIPMLLNLISAMVEVLIPKGRAFLPGNTAKILLNYKLELCLGFHRQESHHTDRDNGLFIWVF